MYTRVHRNTQRRFEGEFQAWLCVVVLAITAPIAIGVAQHRVGGGRALDSSLQVGSRGYNGPPQRRNRRSFAQRDVYTVGRSGDLVYNEWNAFAPRSRYSPVGGTMNPYGEGTARFRYRNR